VGIWNESNIPALMMDGQPLVSPDFGKCCFCRMGFLDPVHCRQAWYMNIYSYAYCYWWRQSHLWLWPGEVWTTYKCTSQSTYDRLLLVYPIYLLVRMDSLTLLVSISSSRHFFSVFTFLDHWIRLCQEKRFLFACLYTSIYIDSMIWYVFEKGID
jgi:hypothetical protein